VIKSIAKNHASFSPVSLCAFYYKQDPSKAKALTHVLEQERAYLKNKYGDPTDIHFMLETGDRSLCEIPDCKGYWKFLRRRWIRFIKN